MPSHARPAPHRRWAVAGLAVVPSALALALPAHAAAALEVTASAESCGVLLTASGLTEGEHTATVTVTSVGSGEVVRALPAAVGTGQGADAGAAPVTAELVLPADGEQLVALDPTAVPDDDVRVEVEVLLDGAPAADTPLTLAACSPQAPGPTSPAPTTPAPTTPAPTTPPPTTTAPTTPVPTTPAPTTPAPTPTVTPSPTDAPTTAPTTSPTTSPTPSTSPSAAPVEPPSSPATGPAPSGSPADVGVTAPSSSWTPGAQDVPWTGSSGELVLGGTGLSGLLSSLGWGASSQLEVLAAAAVPAPVVATPVDAAAAGTGDLAATRHGLDELFGMPQDASAADVSPQADAVLAAPQLSTATTSDPVADLLPAAFVLAASVGGLLTAGRRRSS